MTWQARATFLFRMIVPDLRLHSKRLLLWPPEAQNVTVQMTIHVQIRTPTQRVVDRPDDMTRYLWEEALKALEKKYVDAKQRRRKAARDLESIEAYIAHIQNDINRIRNSLDV